MLPPVPRCSAGSDSRRNPRTQLESQQGEFMADLEQATQGAVNMSLPPDRDSGNEPIDIPFILFVLSNLAGDKELPDLKDRRAYELYTREDVDRLIAAIQPEVTIAVPGPSGPRTVHLTFR